MSEKVATLHVDGKVIELPVLSGTAGHDLIDIRSLAKKGYFTLDPGFLSTASCCSAISYIDGNKGILTHRGYHIAQLAQESTYLEVCYLLFYGVKPTLDQLQEFITRVTRRTMLNDQLVSFFSGFRRDAHPMAIMCGVVGALSSFFHDSLDVENPQHREVAAFRLIAKMPTIAGMCYKYNIGQPFMYPRNDLSYSENFLYMMFGTPCEEYIPDPVVADAMDKIFILHADHEQNASTSTVRLAGSSGSNPFACIAAGIASLWGPAHGGANEACLNMLAEIGTVDRIDEYVARAKDKNDPFRLMGFGHRVYKNFDPRATVMRDTCHEVLKKLGIHDPILDVAMKLEKVALEDPYFIDRKLYPNVDFYSGIILKAIGIPTNMFTVVFAVARTIGWISHWNEMHEDPSKKIARPRQMYVGKEIVGD